MKRIVQNFDIVVAGGGLAGVCAAVAAARHGLKACLVHERPVLGGVASSEMRVTVHGASCHHAYGRETGIIHEILEAERHANHETINENGWTNSVVDMAIYDLVQRTPNLTLHLNTPVNEVVMADGAQPATVLPNTAAGYYERPACAGSRRIAALIARTQSAETELELRAPVFVDCTGDAYVADRAGCAWRMGSEGKAETGEIHAPEQASTDTMGNSIHIRCRDQGRPCPFELPSWAKRYEDPDFFYKQGRPPTDVRGGYWWIEIGVPWHTITDNETIRHELTRHALGVWDWMKNRDPVMRERCRNFALDFIGQVPGKRESRRVVGHHWLTENEVQANTRFPDEIAYGGWFIDLHTPGGLLAPTSEPHSAQGYQADSEYAAKSIVGPYGIPLRSLIARDVDNLFLAGRCISVTRAALGTVRVMGTTALMGQAVGTAAAVAQKAGIQALAADAAVGGPMVRELQQRLLRDGCFLPNVRNADAGDLARSATVSASSEGALVGVTPDEKHDEGGLHQQWGGTDLACDTNPGQLIAVRGGRIDRLALCLSLKQAARIPVRLVRLADVYDYRRDGAGVLAEAVLDVPAGEDRWAWWDVRLANVPDGYVCLQTCPVDGVIWRGATWRLPGHPARRRISPTKLRAAHQTLAFRIEPAQPVWPAANVLSGRTRPGVGPEVWRSADGAGLPQWLQLAWAKPQRIARIELTFPGQLLMEVHSEPFFHAAAQVARDFAIEIDRGDGAWREIHRERGNWHRRRDIVLAAPVEAGRLRLVIEATNGDGAASVAEIRVYGQS